MKYTDTDTLVVLDDQSFSKKFKSFRNIESVLPRIDNYVPIKGDIFIKDRKTKISLEPDNPSWNLDWDWEVNDEGPPKDKEEIFNDFFGELFFAPNELILTDYMPPNQKDYWDYFVFTKKKYLDQKKKHVFKNIKNLYFYKIAHDFLRPKEEKFTLPKSINTENVELLYISRGQVVEGVAPKGFVTEHYDLTPSPLSLAGGGATRLFGQGGIAAGARDVFGDIASGNVGLGTILKAGNIAFIEDFRINIIFK